MTTIVAETEVARKAGWHQHVPVAAINVATSIVLLTVCVAATSSEVKLNDFYREAWPAYKALAQGHLLGFFHLAPAYAGSLLLRAPFAVVPSLLGVHSARAAYFTSALPCAIALAIFVTWLSLRLREQFGNCRASRLAPFVACGLNPVLLVSLLGGHPEEILGVVLCAFAVVLATRGMVAWSSLLIGVAVLNKSWAALAVPVVLLAVPAPHRRTLLVIGAVAAAGVLLMAAAALSGGINGGTVGAQIGTTFNVPQLLWWFGGNSWIAENARYLMAIVVIVCGLVYWLRKPPSSALPDLLLLLALLMLLRAALDPWNNLYYHIPFLLALAAREALVRKVPVLTLAYTYVLLIIVPVGGVVDLPNSVHAAVYAGVVVPTLGWLVWKLFVAPRLGGGLAAPARTRTRVMKPLPGR